MVSFRTAAITALCALSGFAATAQAGGPATDGSDGLVLARDRGDDGVRHPGEGSRVDRPAARGHDRREAWRDRPSRGEDRRDERWDLQREDEDADDRSYDDRDYGDRGYGDRRPRDARGYDLRPDRVERRKQRAVPRLDRNGRRPESVYRF